MLDGVVISGGGGGGGDFNTAGFHDIANCILELAPVP